MKKTLNPANVPTQKRSWSQLGGVGELANRPPQPRTGQAPPPGATDEPQTRRLRLQRRSFPARQLLLLLLLLL
jgi:hypothetical protein